MTNLVLTVGTNWLKGCERLTLILDGARRDEDLSVLFDAVPLAKCFVFGHVLLLLNDDLVKFFPLTLELQEG